ncbi:PmeII family type II restriction endonuclease [Janthinobacterium sp. AD80]|uniref:PmeII family type II restriction endonuclease n=1 Tax=Janthinobacterium sp. AD80 TaxID=1528773 RepID=UPI000C82A457|nr:PmeII family type II restriction endonuclease [Janthinobacterium sp. AD80]PMQ18422.1 hypothetical protein JaAD80_00500 [Janthinobacterium sp. AD80]
MTINAVLLENKIGDLLDIFYGKRSAALDDLKLINTLKRKNPYLYRAAGVADASEIVEEILKAHVSSSDETLFGNEFFEPLAKWVAQQANPVETHTVATSDGEGVDITITTASSIMPIAVKSGVNVFNADSKKKQGENFSALNKRLLKLALHFDPVVGYCYGRKQQSSRSKVNFRELAGQAFWELITGENDFYLRIVRLMGEKPIKHRPEFQQSFDQAKNRFAKEFLIDFSNEDGSINWDKLLEFNSGAVRPKQTRKKKDSAVPPSIPLRATPSAGAATASD